MRLIGCNGTQQSVPLWQLAGGAQVQPSWTASFRMENASDRYSATNAASPIYTNIRYNKGHGIPARFSMGIDDGAGGFTYTRVFTGYIDDITIQSTQRDEATIVCIDNTLPLLQRKVTTTMYVDETVDSWLAVLATEGGVAVTDFDPGLCNIPYCWCDDENSWQEICKVAHSEVGTIFFDRNGTLTFENVEAWAIDARHTVSQHSFTVSRFKDLTFDFDWKDSYNAVIVEYQPRVQSGKAELYKIERAIRVLPGETRTFIARLRYPSPSINVPTPGTDFRVFDVLGNDLSATTTFGYTLYAQRVNVSVVNTDTYRIAILYDYKITGRPILGYPALQEKYQATDAELGNPVTGLAKTLRISNNEYIQTQEQAQLIGALLRDRVKKTRLTYRVTDVPAIPTLQPGDRVTVAEAGAGINTDGFITTIGWKYDGGTYKADYDILDAANWFIYSDYFLMGTDVLAVTSDKVFY